MINVCFFPVVETENELVDLISRAAWFLSFCQIDRIFIPVSSDGLRDTEWQVAPGMDPSIEKNFEKLHSVIHFVTETSEIDFGTCIMKSSVLLHWKKDTLPDFLSKISPSEWKKGKKVLEVDPLKTRLEGSYYVEAGLHLLKHKESLIQENQQKFNRLSDSIGKFKRAYLMATGPSVAEYKNFNYDNCLVVACNSVILDEELMDFAHPQILVFADPIFHFGPSLYAASFREKLLESARKHDYTICIPFKYYGLFTSVLPELADRIIGIPLVKRKVFNFDLNHEFMLKSTANILTFLMVPLAATFADEIGFLGCDGRPLAENTYFWNHNPRTQFNEKMGNIQDVHPAFFNIDYNDYYLEHCQTLDEQLKAGEKSGKKFTSLAFSHIPALSSRSPLGKDQWGQSPQFSQLVSVNPDAESFFGHFLNYEVKLGKALAGRRLTHVIAGPVDAEPEVYTAHPEMEKVFSVRTNKLYAKKAGGVVTDIDVFTAELDHYLSTLDTGDKTLLFMYCGSLEIVEVFYDLSNKHPNCTFAISLYYLSWLDLKSPDLVAY